MGWWCLAWEERRGISSYKPHFTKDFTASQQHQFQLTLLSMSGFLGLTALKMEGCWHWIALEGPCLPFHLVLVTPKDAVVLRPIPGWTSACPAAWGGVGHRSWWQGTWCQQQVGAAAIMGVHIQRAVPRLNEKQREGCAKRFDRVLLLMPWFFCPLMPPQCHRSFISHS